MIDPDTIYEANLKTLSAVYPGVAHLLQSLPDSSTPPPPEQEMQDHAQRALANGWNPDAELHILYRFASSPLIHALFDRIQREDLQENRNRRLLLVEDRPDMFRQDLALSDWRAYIHAERCLFAVDRDGLHVLNRLMQRYPDIGQAPFQLYCGDPACSEEHLHPFQNWLTQFRSSIRERLTALIAQSNKPLPPFPKKIRFFCAGHNIFQDACVQSLKRMGYDAQRLQWKSPLHRFVRATAWTREYASAHPDTAFFLNATPNTFSSQTDWPSVSMRKVCWFVDNPRRYLRNEQDLNDLDVIGVFDPTYRSDLQPNTSAKVIELRTGFGLTAPEGKSGEFSSIDVAFVGELGVAGFLPIDQLWQRYEPETVRIAHEFLHSIDVCVPDFWLPKADEFFSEHGMRYRGALVEFLENKGTSLRRRFFLEALKDLGLHIFGDSGWNDPAFAGPLTASYAGRRLDYRSELPKLYANAKINLNIFHVQCVGAANPRVYDVLACGGFLLTNSIPGLEDEFDLGQDLAVFHTRDELREKVRYYLANPGERREIALRGQARVLAKYGYNDRMQRLLMAMSSKCGESYAYLR